MVSFRVVVLFFTIINTILCENATYKNDDYGGEEFPKKYLVPEDYTPTTGDMIIYLSSLTTVLEFYASEPNNTDVNAALTLFFMRGIIRRSILEDGHKLLPYQRAALMRIMSISEYIMSHHLYANSLYMRNYGVADNEYRITELFRDDDILANSLPDFNQNKLKQWILSRGQINDFIEDMDRATLPKDDFATIVQESASLYHIRIIVSDKCLARISSNLAPKPEDKKLESCRPDPYCKRNIHASPSIAYSLSHRFLNMWMYHSLRRCYWVSPQDDEFHMDILCAFMYREAVYIARRGFFARDLFMEHVALCGMRGYKEFFRRHWFHKVLQWIDDDGCVQEDKNFERNSTVARLQYAETDELKKKIKKNLKINLKKQCHSHPMAVLLMFLANAATWILVSDRKPDED